MRNYEEIRFEDREFTEVRETPEYYESDNKLCQMCGEPLSIDMVFKSEEGEDICAECKSIYE